MAFTADEANYKIESTGFISQRSWNELPPLVSQQLPVLLQWLWELLFNLSYLSILVEWLPSTKELME